MPTNREDWEMPVTAWSQILAACMPEAQRIHLVRIPTVRQTKAAPRPVQRTFLDRTKEHDDDDE